VKRIIAALLLVGIVGGIVAGCQSGGETTPAAPADKGATTGGEAPKTTG
jgi:hypothetical protein